MATITARLWGVLLVCCLSGASLVHGDATRRAELSVPPQLHHRADAVDQVPPHYAAYPEQDAAAMLENAVAQEGAGVRTDGVGAQDTMESTVQSSIQGIVWVLVVCLGLMILAGFNSRKPRPPPYSGDTSHPRLTNGSDAPESDDVRWDEH